MPKMIEWRYSDHAADAVARPISSLGGLIESPEIILFPQCLQKMEMFI